MLTRIEIDGFKSFRNFGLDLPPFLVLVGRNASGKSNLLDAIGFLSQISYGNIDDMSKLVRGNIGEILHRYADGSRMTTMRFAVEVMTPRHVEDEFGGWANVSHTRLRYEVALEVRPQSGNGEALFVASESATRMSSDGDRWVSMLPGSARMSLARYERNAAPDLLATGEFEGRQTFMMWAGSGEPQPMADATQARRTALSIVSTAREFPILFALRRELQSWRIAHVEAAALRTPSSYDDPATLDAIGRNLPNVLDRLERLSNDGQVSGPKSQIDADVARLVPGVVGVSVVDDPTRRERGIAFVMRGAAGTVSARMASDGTLRLLGLLAAIHDPQTGSLVCIEEPENGLFPAQVPDLLEHIRDVVGGRLQDHPRDPAVHLLQVIVVTHSPAAVMGLIGGRDGVSRPPVVFVDTVTRHLQGRPPSVVTRTRPITPDPGEDDLGTKVSPAELAALRGGLRSSPR